MIGVLLALVVLFVYYVIDYYRYVAKYPKGPTPLPFFGNILQVNFQKLHVSFAELAQKYGSIYTVFIPFPTVIIADYNDLREAFLTKSLPDQFRSCLYIIFAGRSISPTNDKLNVRKNAGVFNSSGDEWRDQRRLALMIMRDFGMGKNRMEQLVHESIGDYLDNLKHIKSRVVIDMRWPIQLKISNVINQTLFGFRYKMDDCEELKEYVAGVNQLLHDFVATPYFFFALSFPWFERIPFFGYHAVRKHQRNMAKLIDYSRRHIKTALADFDVEHDEPMCVVHDYAVRMQSNPEELTEEQMLATVHDLLVNAHETTGSTMRWCMLYLARHQEMQERMRQEIFAAVGRARLPRMSDRLQMPYTVAFIHEVQRHGNIIGLNILHRTVEDTDCRGFKIPADTFVNGDLHYIHRKDPAFRDADQFDPMRYLNADGSLNKSVVDRTIAFSIGKRQCPGEGLARMELFLCTAATVQHFRIAPPNGDAESLSHESMPKFLLMPVQSTIAIEPV